MSDPQACCAHCRVVSKHIDNPDGTRSEYWECADGCGQRFRPISTPPPVPKSNPHIIVGEGHRCLCGIYHDGGEYPLHLSCKDVLSAMETLTRATKVLNLTIKELVEERL